MYCTNCGKEINENVNYCPYCRQKNTYKRTEETEAAKEQLEEAVKKFQAGDEDSFDIIYKSVSKTAFILVNSFFPEERSEHEDIVQDIFIHTYKKIGLYDPERASFPTWFQKVAENKCIDRYRAMKKKNASTISMEILTMDEDGKKATEFEDERIEFNPAAMMERNEVSRLIRELMEQLPEKQRQCLMLKFLAHYDIREIAEKLEIPVGTVKSRLFKGKENLSAQVYAMEKRGIKLYKHVPSCFLYLAAYTGSGSRGICTFPFQHPSCSGNDSGTCHRTRSASCSRSSPHGRNSRGCLIRCQCSWESSCHKSHRSYCRCSPFGRWWICHCQCF